MVLAEDRAKQGPPLVVSPLLLLAIPPTRKHRTPSQGYHGEKSPPNDAIFIQNSDVRLVHSLAHYILTVGGRKGAIAHADISKLIGKEAAPAKEAKVKNVENLLVDAFGLKVGNSLLVPLRNRHCSSFATRKKPPGIDISSATTSCGTRTPRTESQSS